MADSLPDPPAPKYVYATKAYKNLDFLNRYLLNGTTRTIMSTRTCRYVINVAYYPSPLTRLAFLFQSTNPTK